MTTAPSPPSDPRSAATFLARHGLTLVALGLLLLFTFPLLLPGPTRGPVGSDWEYFLCYLETLRQSLLNYHQFPGYNPYNALGSPLWANPQVGPLTHTLPLVLLGGSLWGMKAGMAISYFISFFGARALGRRLFDSELAAVMAGLLYALNPALSAHLTRGQLCFGAYAFAPLLLLACLRLKDSRYAGLHAGLIAGVMVHYGVHYYLVYALSLAGILTLWVAFRHHLYRELARFGLLFSVALVALAGMRLLPIVALMSDHPRHVAHTLSLGGPLLAKAFLTPSFSPPAVWQELGPSQFPIANWELMAFPGFLTILFALCSLRRGLRCYHLAALIAFWAMLGNSSPLHLSHWLAKLPVFDSTWLVYRWRVIFVAALAFAAARSIDLLQARVATALPGTLGRWTPRLAWLLPLELIILLLPSFTESVSSTQQVTLRRAELGLPQSQQMLSLRQVLLPKTRERHLYATARINVGTRAGYEPLFGYGPLRTARRYVGHQAYRGEVVMYQQGQPPRVVRPRHWSPNRIALPKLPPGSTVEVNLNPGRGWSLNHQPIFESYRSFEPRKRFVFRVPQSGRVTLSYRPPGLVLGSWLSLAATLLLLAFFWLMRKKEGFSEEAG